MSKNDFGTEITSLGYIYDLYQRKRIAFVEDVSSRQWNKDKQKSFISDLKRNYPVLPLICHTKIKDGYMKYYIHDGRNRVLTIIKHLSSKHKSNSFLLKKLIVLQIIPRRLSKEKIMYINSINGASSGIRNV